MLTEYQITMVEAIYSLIEHKGFSSELCDNLISEVQSQSNEEYAYLHWLLMRWTFLKTNPHHLPARNTSVNVSVRIRKNKQRVLPGDWICTACGDHQFANNTVCRLCVTLAGLYGRGLHNLINSDST
jgi:hypothetical protein